MDGVVSTEDEFVPAEDHIEIRFCVPVRSKFGGGWPDIPPEVLAGTAQMMVDWLMEDDQLSLKDEGDANEAAGATWHVRAVLNGTIATEGGVYGG